MGFMYNVHTNNTHVGLHSYRHHINYCPLYYIKQTDQMSSVQVGSSPSADTEIPGHVGDPKIHSCDDATFLQRRIIYTIAFVRDVTMCIVRQRRFGWNYYFSLHVKIPEKRWYFLLNFYVTSHNNHHVHKSPPL
jgi:hypothetical protein